jgi:transglutaminase-like putative cysteine protease
MKHFAFWFRIALFAAFALVPFAHPGIALAADSLSLWRGLALVPLSAILAFYGRHLPRIGPEFGKIGRIRLSLIAAIVLVFITFAFAGLTSDFVRSLALAAAAYAVTVLAFRRGMPIFLAAEPFAAVWFAWRLSSFSRSSTAVADAARIPDVAIVAASVAVWLAYACMIHAISRASRTDGAGKPARGVRHQGYGLVAILSSVVLALVVVMLLCFPNAVSDFVRSANPPNVKMRPPPPGSGVPRGGNAGSNGAQGSGELYESPASGWGEGIADGQGGSSSNQYLVMVVESPVPSLYLAESYNEILDPVIGFHADDANYLNRLADNPLLETWENPGTVNDSRRAPVWITVYSTIPQKLASWFPLKIEPVVQDKRYYPLQYTYRAQSLVSLYSATGLEPFALSLGDADRRALAAELEVPPESASLSKFRAYAESLVSSDDPYTARIDKILKGLSSCKYKLGRSDDVSVAALDSFLFDTKIGDCSEFSNTAALLARYVGIPSRVVTGYTVQRDLQAPAHVAGARRLIETFPPLAGKNPDDIYLVTTAHRHSWVQFFVPGAGWVDYETTKYAIPPERKFDPNNMDLVIPRIDVRDRSTPLAAIPWMFLLRLFAALGVAMLAFFLVRHWVLLALLSVRSRRRDEAGTKAAFRLFLIRLVSFGYRPKSRSETPREYAGFYTELIPLASLYERAILHPDRESRESARADLDRGIGEFVSPRATFASLAKFVFGVRGRRTV